jgi:monoamine oxidase
LNLPAATRDLVYALAGANAGADPDQVSMLWLLGLIAGGGGSPFGFFMFSSTSSSYTFANGTQDLLTRMCEDSETEVRLSSRITRVVDDGSRVVVTTMDGTEHSAAACVMAVPTNVLRLIDFSPALEDDTAEVVAQNHPGRAIKVWMVADTIPPAPLCIGMAPLQVVLPFKELEDGQCLLVGFGAEGVAPLDPRNRDQVEKALRYYLPDATVIACDTYDWGSDPLFDGTYRVDPPGKHQRTPLIMNGAHGRIVFAGGDIEEGLFRNTMESAIVSGARAAVQVRDLVRP